MVYDQRSVWESTSVRVEPEPNENDRQSEKYRKRRQPTCSQSCTYCSWPMIAGLLTGMIVAGIAFGVFLTLYLLKEDSHVTCATMSTNTPSTTIAPTTTTSTTSTTTSTSTSATTTPTLNVNLVVNGDGETGSCAMDDNITSPTGWSFSGSITQVSYNSTIVTDQRYSYPGPSDRGECYFIGKVSASTSMWQTIDLTNKVNPSLIDSQTIRYNLSAWIGGYYNQDDTAVVSLTFIDSNNQVAGNSTDIGPVFANDRGNITSLIYQQTDGLVPIGTRSMTLCVTINRMRGSHNNGNIDSVALSLY